MGRASAKLPSFCLSGVATRIRIRPPAAAAAAAGAAAAAAAAEAGVGKKADSCQPPPAIACGDDEAKADQNADDGRGAEEAKKEDARVVMVAVDRSPDAKTALLWALSHAVQSHDSLLLLDVVKPPKSTEKQCEKERGPKDYQLLYAMKSICQAKRPEVHVEVCLAEGRDRGPTIVEEAGRRCASLLVVGGPRRRSPVLTWRLLVMWALGADFGGGGGGNARIGSSVADYCIHHAACAALAVRRKGRRGGGYLLTTKRHKDFWLLA